ncbi:CDP-diacylglycerol--glycerol-3-phosphate 3-phosphatidyltransferase [Phragmitibacter flavus]|uniref:CDP-diacylglycerol--glycerol-3-phosphate 3-phosphatidyltransferase n=1 Tax=Phragmitibacter flavus TaxID=2576071 RepID=A0A5R8KK12_9BACT|nr:CDP-diacylglycerol--glycerol-3-phosphate 3-phosphatidyltransferase [Phragmitibacter flavus]TLD72663.1 CDP-diacylglycerol--glycerol-3-phosphate 3-phosphatidyltransferase [Phragmitibacter flavus]
MNLPNKLTVARLALTAVFVVLMEVVFTNHLSWALLVFSVASITDLLDGQIARKYNLVTNFGKLMDPLADKILMTAALIILAMMNHLAEWIVIAILAREFFVTGIRQIASQQGVVLAAEKLGKHKLVWQVITVIYFLLFAASAEPMFSWVAPLFTWKPLSPGIFGNFCIVVMTALTILSGISYFWKNRKLFSDA